MKLAFVFCQMVLKLPCSLLKILSAVQNIPRAVKEVFHNYSDVDGELGDRKFTSSAVNFIFTQICSVSPFYFILFNFF